MSRITRNTFLVAGACLLASACSGQTDAENFGDLQMQLVSYDSQGTEYRLRNAEFEVQGNPYTYYDDADAGANEVVVLRSEDDPDRSVIAHRLLEGRYRVRLRDGWYMERTDSEGETEFVDALLLTSRNQHVYIYSQSTRSVRYRFGVDGTELDFFGGDLEIEIEIVRPEDGGSDADGGVPNGDAAAR